MGQTLLGQDTVSPLIKEVQERMTAAGGVFRDADAIRGALETTGKLLANFSKEAGISSPRDLPLVYRLRDILITQFCYLSAMEDYISQGGKSRGSALYRNEGAGNPWKASPMSSAASSTMEPWETKSRHCAVRTGADIGNETRNKGSQLNILVMAALISGQKCGRLSFFQCPQG